MNLSLRSAFELVRRAYRKRAPDRGGQLTDYDRQQEIVRGTAAASPSG